jgi:hypothetical protein
MIEKFLLDVNQKKAPSVDHDHLYESIENRSEG